jgi:hypothetical protein
MDCPSGQRMSGAALKGLRVVVAEELYRRSSTDLISFSTAAIS